MKLAVTEVKTTTGMNGAKNIFVLVGDDSISRDWIGGEMWSSSVGMSLGSQAGTGQAGNAHR